MPRKPNNTNRNSSYSTSNRNGDYSSSSRGRPTPGPTKSQRLQSLIKQFELLIVLGYTDENWANVSYFLKEISACSDQETIKTLGALMGEMYTFPNPAHAAEVCGKVLAKAESELSLGNEEAFQEMNSRWR